jgi:hypothetical protein
MMSGIKDFVKTSSLSFHTLFFVRKLISESWFSILVGSLSVSISFNNLKNHVNRYPLSEIFILSEIKGGDN